MMIGDEEIIVCSECSALIFYSDTWSHDEWHRRLDREISEAIGSQP